MARLLLPPSCGAVFFGRCDEPLEYMSGALLPRCRCDEDGDDDDDDDGDGAA